MVVLSRFSYKSVGLWSLLASSVLAGSPSWARDSSLVEASTNHKAERITGSDKATSKVASSPHNGTKAAPKGTAQHAAQADGTVSSNQENILVTARRRERMEVKMGGQVGMLGNKKGLDVPFNIRSYTSSLILNQQSQTLGQVLQNDPSVRTTYGYGNFSEIFVIRGLPIASDDVAINGLYGITPRQLVSPQLYDSVQVLNGASAFVNGAAPGGTAIGGNINLQFKHADNDPLLRVTGDYTSGGQGGGSVDMGRRFGENKQFGIRFNAAGMDGQTAIKGERRHSVALGLGLDWRSDDTRISADIDYQNQEVKQGRGGLLLSGVTSVPKPVSPSHNWSQPWSYMNMNYVFGALNVEHDLNKHITLYGAFGGMTSNENGTYSSFTAKNAQTGGGTIGFSQIPYRQTNESTRAGARAHFNTGFFHHEINAGGSSVWEETSRAYGYNATYSSRTNPVAGNLYNPLYMSSPSVNKVMGNLDHPKKDVVTRLYSLFFSDTISMWHDRIALTGGFRFQNILQKGYGYRSVLSSQYDKSAITPVVGLVVHTTKHTSLYFNRVEGLAPISASGTNIVNAGQIFPPVRTEQYEFGGKYDIGRFSASLAFYRLTQPNSAIMPYGNGSQQIFTMNGMQRNQGIELSVNGEIVKGLRFNGGTALIDTKQLKGNNSGKRAIGIPGYTINGNLEYDVPFAQGLTLTGRVMHTGHQWVNVQNSLRIPNWTTFDLGGRYTFMATPKNPLTLRFGVENLANTRYWASSYGGYLVQGMPRVFKASFTTDL